MVLLMYQMHPNIRPVTVELKTYENDLVSKLSLPVTINDQTNSSFKRLYHKLCRNVLCTVIQLFVIEAYTITIQTLQSLC